MALVECAGYQFGISDQHIGVLDAHLPVFCVRLAFRLQVCLNRTILARSEDQAAYLLARP